MNQPQTTSSSAHQKGPSSYENFKAAANGVPVNFVCEVPLYSDAYFVDEYLNKDGPFSLLNPLQMDHGKIGPAIILRCEMREFHSPPMVPYTSNLTQFTGTSPYDEIACLLSLQFGARLLAGWETRRFDGRDELGTPRADTESPTIYLPTGRRRRTVLPWAARQKTIFPGLLPTLGQLDPNEALALIRAARQYRDALWIADENPQLAWLLFVGAVEVVALHDKLKVDMPSDLLRDANPKLYEALKSSGEDVMNRLIPHLAPLFKSAAKFRELFEKFPPPPPKQRPPEGFRFEPWEEKLPAALAKIYDWRSRALHSGIPFPLPMCEPPHFLQDGNEAPCETILGLAAASMGGVWTKAEMPFGLHMFEYLVRSVILAWWSSMVEDASKRSSA